MWTLFKVKVNGQNTGSVVSNIVNANAIFNFISSIFAFQPIDPEKPPYAYTSTYEYRAQMSQAFKDFYSALTSANLIIKIGVEYYKLVQLIRCGSTRMVFLGKIHCTDVR